MEGLSRGNKSGQAINKTWPPFGMQKEGEKVEGIVLDHEFHVTNLKDSCGWVVSKT